MSKYQVTYAVKDVKHTVLVKADTGAEASDVVKEKVGKRIKMINIERCDSINELEYLE